MAKPINWSKDGVIFINFLKPVVKWIRYAPGPTKIAVGVACVCVAGYGLYRRYKKKDGQTIRQNPA